MPGKGRNGTRTTRESRKARPKKPVPARDLAALKKLQAAHAKKQTKNKPGRPAHVPDAKSRESVRLMRATGWTTERIARVMQISHETLYVHYSHELEFGAEEKIREWFEKMQQIATRGKGHYPALRYVFEKGLDLYLNRLDQPPKKPPSPSPEPPKEPKPPKLGKKEQEDLAAQVPDRSTSLGVLMGTRH